MNIKLNDKFKKKLEGMFEKYQFEVGILNDSEHKEAVESRLFGAPELKSYAGGSIRKTSRKSSGKTTGQIFIENQDRLGIDLLRDPFKKKSSDIIKFTDSFMKMVFNKGTATKRVENLLQAIVRNPILRGDYGRNRVSTADNKGFDRALIDTSQMFKAIKAKVLK